MHNFFHFHSLARSALKQYAHVLIHLCPDYTEVVCGACNDTQHRQHCNTACKPTTGYYTRSVLLPIRLFFDYFRRFVLASHSAVHCHSRVANFTFYGASAYIGLSITISIMAMFLILHFAWVVDDAKCGHARLRVCVCVCVSAATCPHYCTDPDVTSGNGTGCPLVVHYWADLQSVHGFRCCDSIREREMSASALFLLYAWLNLVYLTYAITFCVSRRRRKMYCGHAHLCVCVCVCLSVCLSAGVRPLYCTDPDVTWGRGRGCSLVVHYWADLQSVHGLRCYGKITRTLVTSLRPSGDMTT